MTKLSDKQIEKYSRQIIIDSFGISGQKKIIGTKVLIVGCGQIAGGFDMSDEIDTKTQYPLSHAGAFNADKRFSLTACVEPDRYKRENFMRYWNIPTGFDNLRDVKKGDFDHLFQYMI